MKVSVFCFLHLGLILFFPQLNNLWTEGRTVISPYPYLLILLFQITILLGRLSIPEPICIVLIVLAVKRILVSDRAHSRSLFSLVNFVVGAVAIFSHFSSVNCRINFSHSVKNLLGFKLEMHCFFFFLNYWFFFQGYRSVQVFKFLPELKFILPKINT